MFDKSLLIRKIKLMKRDIEKLKPFKNYSFNELAKDEYLYLSVERLLEKIINRAIDINTHIIIGNDKEPPQEHRDSFIMMIKLDILPEKFVDKIIPSVGLRNRLVHEYDDLDAKQVYKAVFTALNQYPKYLGYIKKYIKKNA